MSQIRNLNRRLWDKKLKDNGIDAFNGAQGRILHVLWEHGRLTSTEIGRLTSLAKTTLTSMLDRMESGGLISRVQDKNNRRQVFVTVAGKAKEHQGDYSRIAGEINGILYRGFTQAEIADFESYLRRIVRNLRLEKL